MKILLLLIVVISHPSFASFDSGDLNVLIQESIKHDSDVLMVWKDGQLLHSYDADQKKQYSIQSVTKSLNALTVSCILKNTPEQLNTPNLFPDWEGTEKSAITLKMLLTMTSGIVDPKDPWGRHDFYQHAAKQPLTYTPGNKFVYANTSPMIIGKWIKETTGHQFSYHVKKCMFNAMGISNWRIGKDAKKNEVVAGGVRILAKDLLKVGIMLIQNGIYEGKKLYTPKQVKDLRLGGRSGYGLGFWLWGSNMYYAAGYLGQYLIMVPSENLVILRLRNKDKMRGTTNNKRNTFNELPGLVSKLIK